MENKIKTIKPSKPKKARAAKYDEKLKINGSFEELVKELITPKEPIKKAANLLLCHINVME